MELDNELIQQLNEKIIVGQELLVKVSRFSNVNGISKLHKKIKQEVNFLVKILQQRRVKKEHLLCTNLHHFVALVNTLETCNDIIAVLQHFSYKPGYSTLDAQPKRLCVDVVSEKGRQWIKVVARNPRALSQLCTGAGEYGQRNVIDQAREFLVYAQQHPCMFHPPEVVFVFSSGIEKSLAALLETIGVTIVGERLADSSTYDFKEDNLDEEDDEENEMELVSVESEQETTPLKDNLPNETTPLSNNIVANPNRLNLDVTTALAYVSALTNGGADWDYKQPILKGQAAREMKHPVKPVLEALFDGKELYMCRSAFESFMSILKTLGGEGEKKRAATELIPRLVVVDDGEEKWENLKTGGKVKERSRAVFATGLTLGAITVTANAGFVRSAKNQGYEFPVFVHESRALTEGKQFGPPLSF